MTTSSKLSVKAARSSVESISILPSRLNVTPRSLSDAKVEPGVEESASNTDLSCDSTNLKVESLDRAPSSWPSSIPDAPRASINVKLELRASTNAATAASIEITSVARVTDSALSVGAFSVIVKPGSTSSSVLFGRVTDSPSMVTSASEAAVSSVPKSSATSEVLTVKSLSTPNSPAKTIRMPFEPEPSSIERAVTPKSAALIASTTADGVGSSTSTTCEVPPTVMVTSIVAPDPIRVVVVSYPSDTT